MFINVTRIEAIDSFLFNDFIDVLTILFLLDDILGGSLNKFVKLVLINNFGKDNMTPFDEIWDRSETIVVLYEYIVILLQLLLGQNKDKFYGRIF